MKPPLNQEPFRIQHDESGHLLSWGITYNFVPHGFLSTELFALGNGDSCGFYWAIGKEDEEPIIGEIYHDSGTIIPIASTLEGLARIKILTDSDDLDETAQVISSKLNIKLPDEKLGKDAPLEKLLEQDANAPASLLKLAKNAIDRNKLELAEQYLLKSLSVLPEYTDAHYLLALIYRRQPSTRRKAAIEMIKTITSPLVFLTQARRKQVLSWLQRLNDEDYPELRDDPIWINRNKLTFEIFVKTNDDFTIYEEAIEEYLLNNQGIEAVRLRTLVAELMYIETQAFRDRYNYSDQRHKDLLVENLWRADISKRISGIRA